VRLGPLGTADIIGVLYQLQMIDDGDCGAIDGMKVGRGNRSTWRLPVPVSFFLPQTPHDLTRAWTQAASVGSQRLTACAMARLRILDDHSNIFLQNVCWLSTDYTPVYPRS
jgi:hypothetical protein